MHLKGNVEVENLGNQKFNVLTTIYAIDNNKEVIMYENSVISNYGEEFHIIYNREVSKLDDSLQCLSKSIALINNQNINENKILSKFYDIEDELKYSHILNKRYEKVVKVGE
jgi:hypothetical protein